MGVVNKHSLENRDADHHLDQNIPINAVDPTTAGQPPPKDLSRIIGKVSFVITLLSKSVTKTQCLPLFNNLSTLPACFFSFSSPES